MPRRLDTLPPEWVELKNKSEEITQDLLSKGVLNTPGVSNTLTTGQVATLATSNSSVLNTLAAGQSVFNTLATLNLKDSSTTDIESAVIKNMAEIQGRIDAEESTPQDEIDFQNSLDYLERLALAREGSGLTEEEIDLVSSFKANTDSVLVSGEEESTGARISAKRIIDATPEERKQILTDYSGQEQASASTIKTAYQCFLLYNIEHFSSLHKILLSQGSSDQTKGYKKTVNDEIKSVGYVKKGSGEARIYLSEETEESAAMINKLKICPGNDVFSKIKTHEYAQLIPLLKIYKVYRNRNTFGDVGLVEMEFDARTNTDGIERILETVQPSGKSLIRFSKGTSCGVKSFDWKFIGSDTFTASRDIDATLKLFFQDFSELVKVRKNVNLLSDTSELEDYKYLDLLVLPDCRDPSNLGSSSQARFGSSRVWRPECYEIRVDVGYSLPVKVHDFDPKLKESICCQRDSLHLTPVDHGFDFRDDGTIELTINYKGRIENIMNDRAFNILMPGGGFYDIIYDGESVQGLEDKIIKEKDKKRPNKTRINELERKRTVFFTNYSQIFYNNLLRQMNELGYIHKRSLNSSEYYKYSMWRTGAVSILPDPLPVAVPASLQASDGEVDSILSDLVDASSISPDQNISDKVSDKIDIDSFNQRLIKASKGREHTVNYFFMGDLFGVVAATVFGDYFFTSATDQTGNSLSLNLRQNATSMQDIIDNFHLILGNSKFTINNKELIVNLAHLPVSLEIFHEFMLKNVVGLDSIFYSFTDFLDDFISHVVTGILGDDCFDGAFSTETRTNSTLITSQSELNPEVFVGTPYKSVALSKITPSSHVAFDLCRKDKISETLPKDYLIVDTVNRYPENLSGVSEILPGIDSRGDPIGDKARGIYHFTLGEDRGILKKAKFQKTDQEYLPESRYTSEGDFVFNQLSNVYDANFEMLGNNLFRNGMLIYFDSSPIGAGAPWQRIEDRDGAILAQSWANIMGLGGYHLITEINHSIKPGSYLTSIKARWQTGGESVVDETVVTNTEITEVE